MAIGGRKSHHALNASLRKQVLELAQSTYAGSSTQHFTKLLDEREGIVLSRSSVRRILLEVGIKSPRKRRFPKRQMLSRKFRLLGLELALNLMLTFSKC